MPKTTRKNQAEHRKCARSDVPRHERSDGRLLLASRQNATRNTVVAATEAATVNHIDTWRPHQLSCALISLRDATPIPKKNEAADATTFCFEALLIADHRSAGAGFNCIAVAKPLANRKNTSQPTTITPQAMTSARVRSRSDMGSSPPTQKPSAVPPHV